MDYDIWGFLKCCLHFATVFIWPIYSHCEGCVSLMQWQDMFCRVPGALFN